MENEDQQKELFEFEGRPKRIFPSLGNMFQKNGFENKYMVTMSPERLVFVAIGLVMALVLVYALGVERGKTFALRPRPIPVVNKAQPMAKPAVQPAILKAQVALPATPVAKAPAATQAAVVDPKPAVTTAAFYTIIACTFTKDATAAAEVNRLKSEGLDAYVYQNDSYFQVCSGKFADPAGAKDYLARVRRYFKDAYVKYRQ